MAKQLSLFPEPKTEQLPLFQDPLAAGPEPEADPKERKRKLRFLALDDLDRPRNRVKART